ncbi:MAG: hypothetical protein ABIB43_06640 [archaeon]
MKNIFKKKEVPMRKKIEACHGKVIEDSFNSLDDHLMIIESKNPEYLTELKNEMDVNFHNVYTNIKKEGKEHTNYDLTMNLLGKLDIDGVTASYLNITSDKSAENVYLNKKDLVGFLDNYFKHDKAKNVIGVRYLSSSYRHMITQCTEHRLLFRQFENVEIFGENVLSYKETKQLFVKFSNEAGVYGKK